MSIYRSGVSADDFDMETLNFYCGRSVCVTGGSGFIGSHVVEQLIKLDARPVVSTRRAQPPFLAQIGSKVEIRRGDLAEPGVAEAAGRRAALEHHAVQRGHLADGVGREGLHRPGQVAPGARLDERAPVEEANRRARDAEADGDLGADVHGLDVGS